MSKLIPLTQGKMAKVDDQDYNDLLKYKWYATFKKKWYARRSGSQSETEYVYMHTHILGALGVDHINGDSLDNRRCNIRIATQSQNLMNRDNPTGLSSYRGVTWAQNRWVASIKKDGKSTYLGRFVDETEAARAYDIAALQLHGEFARLNFKEV